MIDMSEEELEQEQRDGEADQKALEEKGLTEQLVQKDREIEDLKKQLESCHKLKTEIDEVEWKTI